MLENFNNIIMDNYMDKIDIHIINLKSRQDRLEQVINEFKDMDFINLNIFEAIKDTPSSLGCLKSHLTLIEHAKMNNLPYIIVMEDDIKLNINKDEFKELLSKLIELKDVDIFNGCPSYIYKYKTNLEIYDDDLVLTNFGRSTAFIIYYQNSYDKFNRFTIRKKYIDKFIEDNFKQLISKRIISYQRESY